MKRITVLVSNDLEFDQRVKKVCTTLAAMGFEIHLVGRMMPNSKPFESPFHIHRFKLPSSKGAMFYVCLNVFLFFHLLFKPTDIIVANDLDTLLPAFIVARIRGKKLVYDSHEYFTEAEGLTGRNGVKKIWETIEKWIFPKLKYVYTVNESIAGFYRKKYDVKVDVVRNVPPLSTQIEKLDAHTLGLDSDKKIIVLQGAYIDPDRGAAEAILAMKWIEGAVLLIIGSGREMIRLKEIISNESLETKVKLLGKLPYIELCKYTSVASLGLSLDKPIHLNYKYSLPNKVFDYIHAGVPVLLSKLPELERLMGKYEIGLFIEEHEPQHVAQKISEALHSSKLDLWRKNLGIAALENNWQVEEKVIQRMYKELL
ncbi:MAG: glycosyltransferase [Flavobacteriales bacterium]|nr:glycosyltransferase [Flavobacteriales bacterium]